jgi:hypothetical protein
MHASGAHPFNLAPLLIQSQPLNFPLGLNCCQLALFADLALLCSSLQCMAQTV